MKEFIKKYYLNECKNYFFVICIVYNVFMCMLCYIKELNYYVQLSASVVSVMSFCGLTLYSKQTAQNVGEKNKIEEIYIARNSWFSEIFEKQGIIVLTGASGIGKTCLLNQLLQELDKKYMEYYYENGNYFWSLSEQEIFDKEYVILDQFERALTFDNIIENIQTIKKLNEQKVIISVRKEYLGDVYKLFGFDPILQTVWLEYRENEIKKIEKYLQKLTLETNKTLNSHSFYSPIIEDVRNGSLSMIQLSCLVREIQYRSQEYVRSQMKKYTYMNDENRNESPKRICDYNAVIRNDWELQLDEYEYSEMAYMILYLLCLDYNGKYTNTVKDFENICIQDEHIILKVLGFLKDHKWIKKVKESYDVHSRIEPYEIAHDYMLDMFEKICRNRLSSDIRNNIDYYHINCQIQRNAEDKEDSWKNYTNTVCKIFLNPKSRKYVDIWLYYTILFISFTNGIILNKIHNSKDNQCLMLLALNVIVGLSVYYVYNYYYYFIAIYNWRYLPGILLAAPAIMLPFL